MSVFCEEDHKMLELKNLCKLYDRRVSLALIPFYIEKKEFIEERIAKKEEDDPELNLKDI